ncbi:MAG: hypothetical protein QGH11_04990 [Pirellulaceae bacterium]|nr:hypothetical protein [Pirellulaceae bacterium]
MDDNCLDAVMRGDLSAASFSDPQRALLEFTELLTRTPHMMTEGHAQRLRDAGWSDPQLAEAVYIISLFAFFNRVANAFGLDEPPLAPQGSPDGPGSD